ncbi:pyrroline-5-carboxylate reductase [Glaciecola sp. 2405UD65-10]|uniref:pyrroline-5-carboxylate reductase n=1 Tax=Glaciecola sp. 2405UD65-10 TaxID=3397244 RepID=UPI003B5B8B52
MNNTLKISFIGAGNMSKAIIGGLVEKGFKPENIMASNPSNPKLIALNEKFGIQTTNDNQAAINFADVVMLSVKPQLMEDVCANFTNDKSSRLFVSIAAGLTIERLSDFLPKDAKIIRVMPNTPSAIGMGMSGIFAPSTINEEETNSVADIMQSVGETLIVAKEDDINTVIAAAGSSPAYFFLIGEAMQTAAENMGLNANDARKLVVQAMLGSAYLMQKEQGLELSELRAQVTSKGGTTAKAVESLQDADIHSVFANAMQAAVARAKEMSKQF